VAGLTSEPRNEPKVVEVRRLIVVTALLAAVSCGGAPILLDHQAPATFAQEPGGFESAEVVRIVDGDTIVVRITDRAEGPGAGAAEIGREYRVRFVGIDTPESVKPGSPVECFGKEASAATTALLEGHDVRLVKDVEEVDHYDRLLRYVYSGDEMANARLVVNGYAHAYTYPPDVRHADLFVTLQRDAYEHNRGLWAPGACAANRGDQDAAVLVYGSRFGMPWLTWGRAIR
jgi:micrococcal nuclease